MADRVISQPNPHSLYLPPTMQPALDNDGITDRIEVGQRRSSYILPVPRLGKRGAQQQLGLAELTAVPEETSPSTTSGLRSK